MKRSIIFVDVSRSKGLVHTPIQIPSKNVVLSRYQVRLEQKFPRPNWISDQLATPSRCTILRLKKAAKLQSFKTADLWDKPHKNPSCNQDMFRWLPKIDKNSASSADDHRQQKIHQMILGYFIAKKTLCHLWEATVSRNLWGTTQASATWLKPRCRGP